jgi:hypothetical protein
VLTLEEVGAGSVLNSNMDRFGKNMSRMVTGLMLLLPWSLLAAPVDQKGARAAAEGWLAESPPHLAARFHPQVKRVESFTGFHVIQLEPEGYIVTAADDEMEPVLAFSDHGTFKYDSENPLCILLNRDIQAHTKQLQDVKGRRKASIQSQAVWQASAATADDLVLAGTRQATDKWEKFKSRAPAPQKGLVKPAVVQPGLTTSTSVAMADLLTNGAASSASIDPTNGVHISEIKIVEGHVQLTHDAAESVAIYASYDGGQTWQVEDTGIVWPTWTAKRSVQEAACMYRVAVDHIYDPLAVSLMRNPSPLVSVAPDSSLTEVSAPAGPGLVGSKSSLSDVRVSPLVQSYWNQSTERGANCYNYYTPNNYVDGCVATALAQLMRYWQYPTAGIGRVSKTVYVNGSGQTATTRGGDGSGGAYNWSAMPLSPSTATYNLAQWQMIGALCYDAGVSVNMQYASGGSGAYMYLCAGALTGVFQYANAKYVNYPGDILTPVDSDLAAGCPVLFGISSSGSSGHAIVCDGFGYDSGTLYHHINFGWDGAYNAWYALPVLGTPYNFNRIDTIIYNVYPSGTGEVVSGRVTTSQGAPVQGATITITASGQTYPGTTDSKGYYGIKVPSAQTCTVMASKLAMGMATRSGVVTGTSGTSGSGNCLGIDFTLNNNFSFSAMGLAGCVSLRWTAPTNSGMPNNTVYIRSRTDRYPTNATDGSLVYTGTALQYQDTGANATGSVTNYYTIWGDDGSPYASLGNSVTGASVTDAGKARLLWIGNGGEVCVWNLKTAGGRKSSGPVFSGQLSSTYWRAAGFNDIDQDGVSDILWTGAGGEVAYWLLNADGTLKTSGYVTAGNATGSGYWSVAGFADIDHDGIPDILWTSSGGDVAYWLLNADGTRKSAGSVTNTKLSPATYWKVGGFADIDRDGTADILWTGAGGEVAYWLLKPDGTLKSSGLVVAGNATGKGYWTVAGFKDIDGDGTADILWSGAGGEVAYWLLNSNGTRKSSGLVYPSSLTPAGYWSIRGFQDVNGDGVPDIIWHGRNGETACWFLNASGTYGSGLTIEPMAVTPSYWTIRGAGRCSP